MNNVSMYVAMMDVSPGCNGLFLPSVIPSLKILRQHDVTAKCIILSSLNDNVFNRVYSFENAKELWKTIIENHEGTEDVVNERYHVLIDKLNSFNNLMIRMPNLCTHD